jgi:hypothetical protein
MNGKESLNESTTDYPTVEEKHAAVDAARSGGKDVTIRGTPLFLVRIVGPNKSFSGTFFVRFKCPGCGGVHEHGWCGEDDPNGATHRWAHCVSHRGGRRIEGNALEETGYWIGLDQE